MNTCLQEIFLPTSQSVASVLQQEFIFIPEPCILFCSGLLHSLLFNSVSCHLLKVNCVIGSRKDVRATFHFLFNRSIIACVDTLKRDHSMVSLF